LGFWPWMVDSSVNGRERNATEVEKKIVKNCSLNGGS
jgi:hypothetical protein